MELQGRDGSRYLRTQPRLRERASAGVAPRRKRERAEHVQPSYASRAPTQGCRQEIGDAAAPLPEGSRRADRRFHEEHLAIPAQSVGEVVLGQPRPIPWSRPIDDVLRSRGVHDKEQTRKWDRFFLRQSDTRCVAAGPLILGGDPTQERLCPRTPRRS